MSAPFPISTRVAAALALETYCRLDCARRSARPVPWIVLVRRERELRSAEKLVEACEPLQVDARDAVQLTFDEFPPPTSAQRWGIVSPPFNVVLTQGPQIALRVKGARLARGQFGPAAAAHADVAGAIEQTEHLLRIIGTSGGVNARALVLACGMAEVAWIASELACGRDIDVPALRGTYSAEDLREAADLVRRSSSDAALRRVLRRGAP